MFDLDHQINFDVEVYNKEADRMVTAAAVIELDDKVEVSKLDLTISNTR